MGSASHVHVKGNGIISVGFATQIQYEMWDVQYHQKGKLEQDMCVGIKGTLYVYIWLHMQAVMWCACRWELITLLFELHTCIHLVAKRLCR